MDQEKFPKSNTLMHISTVLKVEGSVEEGGAFLASVEGSVEADGLMAVVSHGSVITS